MKHSIKNLLDAIAHDNAQVIKENGGNVAEYIISTAEAIEYGWHEFLSDEEIEEYESADAEKREEIRKEIRNSLTKNNYNLLADDLLEKWIVVFFPYADHNDAIRVTRRNNFEKMDFCKAYDNNGVQVDCYNAGCYTLDNSGSVAQSDCSSAVNEKFNVCVSLEKCAGSWTVIPANEDDEFSDELISEIKKYIKEWQDENETHTEVTGWTYHDSHNFKTVVSEANFGEADCTELDEEEQIEILLQMPETAPYMDGFNTSEETEDFIFHFDRWATNPWFCYVERK